MIYTKENWAQTINAMHSGEMIEIDEEIYDYFLEVLPPVRMGWRVKLPPRGFEVWADFGFAEGAEPITAFWRGSGLCSGRFYCQRTEEMNRS